MKPKKEPKNRDKAGLRGNHTVRAYLLANQTFLLCLLLVFLYFGAFRAGNHPIQAWLTELTGVISPSKGLSAAFSEILRLNIKGALHYNPYAIRVFSFFGIQLFLRILAVTMATIYPQRIDTKVMLLDTLISLLLFTYSFYPLISFTLQISAELLQ